MPTENKPADPFQREDRYIVIKRSDMDKAPAELRRSFSTQCRKLHDGMFKHGAPARQFVVVESGWPEYHLVWAMLEHRMAGKPVPDFNLWRRADELQQHLTVADERVDVLETGLKWETERNALLLAELETSKELDRPDDVFALMSMEADKRIELLEGLLRDMSDRDCGLISSFYDRIDAALKPAGGGNTE